MVIVHCKGYSMNSVQSSLNSHALWVALYIPTKYIAKKNKFSKNYSNIKHGFKIWLIALSDNFNSFSHLMLIIFLAELKPR